MFELVIRDGFSSAHALRHYRGGTEPLHGHNFAVEVVVSGKRLKNKVKYLSDFVELRQILRDIVKPMDHINLNDYPAFRTENPTAENIAVHIAGELRRRWRDPGVRLASVTVWETDHTAARYRP